MAAEAKLPTGNADPVKELLDILGQFGTGTTTTRSSPEGGVSSQADALMQSILGSANPDNMANLVQGILLKAKTAFGPNIAASIGAGNRTVSDSALGQLQSEAAAKATAESAQAVLEAQTNAQRLATSIVNTKLNASKVQTQRTGITPAGKGIIGLTVAQKAKKLLSGNETNAVTGDKTSQPEQLGYTQDQLANIAGPEALGFSQDQLTDLGATSGTAAAVTDVIPGGVSIADAPFLGPFNFDENTTSPADVTGDTTSVGGGGSSGDPFTGNSPGFGGGDPNIDPTTGEPLPNPDDHNTPPPDDQGCFLCWIVCTELHRQGKLPTRWYIPGSRVFAKYDDNIKRGYYFWAIPLSKHLRYFPDSILSKITTIGCNHRAEFIAHKAGIRGARKTLRGWIVIHSLYWICWFIGKVLPKNILLTTEQIHGRTNS